MALFNNGQKTPKLIMPNQSDNLQGSGMDIVFAQTLYSVIGAIALEKGGEVANRTVREKILSPLGLR